MSVKKKRNYGKVTILLMVFLLGSKFLGLFRDSYIAKVFGSTATTDVFFLVNSAITLLSGLISQAINTCAIPILSEVDQKEGIKGKLVYINNLLHSISFASIVIVIIICIFVEPISSLLAPGFDLSQLSLMKQLIYIGAPCLIFYGIVGVRRSYLQYEGSFIESGITDLVLNCVYVVALIFINQKYGVYVLMISALIAAICQVSLQRMFMLRSDYKYSFVFKPRSPEMVKTLSLIWPVFLSSCISDINKLIEKALASKLTAGALSALTYSSKINTLFLGIFITAITTVIFPLMSKAANANDDLKSFKGLILKGVDVVFAITLPSAIALITVGYLVVQILYQRGSFTVNDTMMVNDALVFYALALPGMSIRLVSVKAFYSLQDTKTPVINGTICIVLNIVLNIILMNIMGHVGLALATAIASDTLAIVLMLNLYRKISGFDIHHIFMSFIKTAFASAVMGIIVFGVYHFALAAYCNSFISRVFCLGVLAAIGIIVYLVLAKLLKIDIINEIINNITSKFRKEKV